MKQPKTGSKSNTKYYVAGAGGIIVTCFLIWLFAFSGFTFFPPPEPTPVEGYSYVNVTDWTDGENLNEVCPVQIYGNKVDLETIDEIYDIANYEIAVSECMPDKVRDDLSEYDYIIIRCNPDEATDGYWTMYDSLYANLGLNRIYNIEAFHEATDFHGFVHDQESSVDWTGLTSNVTIGGWFPIVTTAEPHYGTGWTITTADFDDLSTKQLERLYNEKWHRNQPTLFSLADDTADHTKSGDYVMITETSVIEVDFNCTISFTDGNAQQVNVTTDCVYDHYVEYDDDAMYFVFVETWDCYTNNLEFNFAIDCAVNISGVTVCFGRSSIPDRSFSGTAGFTSMEPLLTVA